MNLRDRILETGDWEMAKKEFRERPIWSQSEALLIEIEGPSVFDDQLDVDLRGTNLPIRDVWFLSKHAAASGVASLTVHPIGNPGEAKYGGKPGVLSPTASRDMGALLRRIKHHAKQAALPHQVTFEGTHHGPHMSFPTLFVEIGSSDAHYGDPVAGRTVAAAIQDVLAGGGRCTGPILVQVGGGHYHPRATDAALAGQADFGHLIPGHALESTTDLEALIRQAVAKTPGCAGVRLDRKSMKGPMVKAVDDACKAFGVEVVSLASA